MISVAAVSGSALNSYALRPSMPGAFPFYRVLIAFVISSFVGGSKFISRSSSALSISGISSGSGRFKISWKISVHLCSISFSVVSNFPCLSLTDPEVFEVNFPHIRLVILS